MYISLPSVNIRRNTDQQDARARYWEGGGESVRSCMLCMTRHAAVAAIANVLQHQAERMACDRLKFTVTSCFFAAALLITLF